MAKKATIEQVIQELRVGHDREANYKLLFEYYFDRVYRFFQRKNLPAEDCRDLTQEVFVSVYKGLPGLRDETQFQSWLFRIARNILQNTIEYRHAKKRSAREVSLEEKSKYDERRAPTDRGETTPIETLLEKERYEQLSEALGELPAQMQRCVRLRVVNGLPNAEIAALMGISVNTVKAHLHQARLLLKKKLGEHSSELKK